MFAHRFFSYIHIRVKNFGKLTNNRGSNCDSKRELAIAEQAIREMYTFCFVACTLCGCLFEAIFKMLSARFNRTLQGGLPLLHYFSGRHARSLVCSQALLGVSLALAACQPFSAGSDNGSQAGGASGAAGQQQQAGASTGAGSGGVEASAGSADTGGAPEPGGGANGIAGAAIGGSAGLAGGSPAGGAGGAASSCPCSAPTPTCEANRCVSRGPKMVRTTSFYIDSTEVTNAQYAVFQAAKGDIMSGQVAECAWNTTYEPLFVQGQPLARANVPVTNVDWCDAAAYCAWADKQLCGKIGGGELQLAELADPTKSQWYLACAGPKAQPYPYGTSLQNGACNDGSSGNPQLAEVGKFDQCQGYYNGLFDMLGNAQEWTQTCSQHAGEHDICERIGGSYQSTKVCSDSGAAERSAPAPQVGFRCCSK
jgi:sulfatase modifying factor 1